MLRRVLGTLRDELVAAISPTDTIDFGAFSLKIDRRDYGGRMYRQGSYWGTLSCPFETDLVDHFKPRVFLDVGANYGFTSLAHHARNPGATIVAVEPAPSLVPFLQENLRQKGVDAIVVPAACASEVSEHTEFALNPSSSQDNRVVGRRGWKRVSVRTVSVDHLLAQYGKGFVLVKIDTQGYEAEVIAGAQSMLESRSDWAIKMEFAPKWLRSQGTDPTKFLASLIARFHVAEIPQRPRFRGDDVLAVAKQRLTPEIGEVFVRHVESRAHGDGWCDLLIVPMQMFT